MAGEIISEWWATSNRNGGRDHSGTVGDIERNQQTIRMDFSSFDDFWTPHEGNDGPFADYLRTLEPELKHKVREAVRAAYLDGEADGARSYAATAWCVKGTVS